MDFELKDISALVLGKYQHCTQHEGRWYSDQDFDWRGRLKAGAVPRPEPARKYTWPDCEPPQDGVWSGGCNMNGTNYMKKEVSPGRWQWVVNEEAERREHEAENRRRELWWALKTRPLTDEEMTQVKNYGSHLNIENNQPYYEKDKTRELNDALARQWEMQAIALKMGKI